jgi:hypothetical protein
MAIALTWYFKENIVSAALPPAPPREPVDMADAGREESGTSDNSDLPDLPLDFSPLIDAAEYLDIMSHVFPCDDETVTRVSAFNSAI